jgi:N-methylhydantoinase A
MSAESAAAGIVTLVDSAMAKALRIVTVERGLDPRDFMLVAFGGGGPLHACALADELEIARVVIPSHPGLFSACGLLDAPLRFNDVRSVLSSAETVDVAAIERAFVASESRARQVLVEQGAASATIAFAREYDARYGGQSFDLTIAYDPSPQTVIRRFHEAHRARYGYDVPGEVVEVINARLTATAFVPSIDSAADDVEARRMTRDGTPAMRAVWLDDAYADVPVFERNGLVDGTRIEGPAIVESYDSTAYVASKWSLDVKGDLLLLQRSTVSP